MGLKDYFRTLGFVVLCAVAAIYLNSVLAYPIYVDGSLVSVEYTTNFFFAYETPIGYELKNVNEWYIYMLILIGLTISLLFVFYLPYIIKERKLKNNQ